jgi:hypothetical protein
MGVQVSKGFLVFAQNTADVDYVQQAYALALSIKLTQKEVIDISLVTDSPVPKKYLSAFDQVLSIPFGDQSNNSKFRTENRWKLYHASPYDETIVLDSDMLVLEDIATWWKYCGNYDIRFCNSITNYKLQQVTDNVHRKTFASNNLTNPYFALHYFKKSHRSLEFFKVLEFVINNWEWFWTKFAPENYQDWLSMDLAVAIAIEVMCAQEEFLDANCPLKFVHMKTPLQGWNISNTSWQDSVLYNFNGDLTVGNIQQQKIFHYVENDFLSDKIINRLEELTSGQAK